MPFDPTTAAPVDTPAFDPSSAFDPTSATPVDAETGRKPLERAPVEPGAWNDPEQHSRFGNAAMGALMGGGADVIDTVNRVANWVDPEEHPDQPGSVAYTANWLRSHAPQNTPAQGKLEKAEDLAGGVTGGFGPGALEYMGKVPFAALHGLQTAQDEAQAQGRDPTLGEMARDVVTEAGGRKIMGALEAAPIGKLKKALGFGAVTGGQDVVEGKDKGDALQNAAVNTLLGAVLPGGEHGTEAPAFDPTTAKPVGEPTAPSAVTPDAAPNPGDAIGIKFPKGPSQRATVDSYWDDGQSVRVRYDDGRTQDMLTHEMLRDQTQPPPPVTEASGPGGPRYDAPSPDEMFNLWDEADRAAPQQGARPPAPAPLGADAIAAVGRADSLETQANDTSNKLSAQDREDMLLTAQRLRQQFGHTGAPPVITPEDQARANSARAAAPGDRTLLDQASGAPSGPAGFTPEEIAAAQQNTGTTPNLMGQEVPNLSRAPAQFTPDELAAAAAARQTQAQATARQAPGSGPLLDAQGLPQQVRPVAPRPVAAQPASTDGRSSLLVPVPPRNAQTLMQWVRANGGIRDTSGDLNNLFRANGKRPPPGIIANQNGMGADDMARRAQEAGYFSDPEDQQHLPDQLTSQHLFDAIEDEMNGQPHFSDRDRDSVDAHEGAKAHNENIRNLSGTHGVDFRGTTADAFHAAVSHSEMKMRAEDMGIKLTGNESPATVAALVHEKELAAQRPTQFPAQADAIDRHLDARFGQDLPDALDDIPWADEDAHTAAKAGVPPEPVGGFAEGVAGHENPAGPTGERQAIGALGEGRGGNDGSGAGTPGAHGFEEPSVERTDQGDQYVMPGAERSAVQAAKARGETLQAGRPQKGADFGLFAKPDAQTDMFARQTATPKPDEDEDFFTREAQKYDERQAEAERLANLGPQSIKFTRPDGRSALAGPEIGRPGGYRLTFFDDRGPSGHVGYNDLKSAVIEALTGGFKPVLPKVERGTLADFHQFAADADHPIKTPAEANKAVADYTMTRGAETGHEYMGAVDGKTGEVYTVATSGRPNAVTFPPELMQRLADPGDIVLHHNHPKSTPLSAADMMMLGMPGTHSIVAHGSDGGVSSASATPEMRAALSQRLPQFAQQVMGELYKGTSTAIRNRLQALVNSSIVSADAATAAHGEMVLQALDAAGVIDHISSRSIGDMDPKLADTIMRDVARAVSHTAEINRLPVRSADDVGLYRSPESLQPTDAVGEISRRASGDAAARQPSADGDGGSARDNPVYPEADKSGQGRLLESDEERYRSERAGPQYASRDGQINMAPVDYDPVDDVSRQIAANSEGSGQPPGIVARKAAGMMPRADQSPPTKVLGWLQRGAITPRTLAAMDWRSSKFWQAWKEKDNTARALQHHWSEASQPYADLTADQRAKLSAVEELDRMQNIQRPDDGRQIVARNEASARAEFSKPGQSVVLDPQTTEVYHQRRALFRDVWTTLMQSSAKKLWPAGMDYNGTVDADEISKMAQATASKPLAKQLNNIAELMQAMDSQRNLAYTPLMRFGDYYIAIKPKPGTQGADAMDWDGNGYPPVARFELIDSRGADTLLQRLAGKVIKGGDLPPAAADRMADLKARYPDSGYDVETGYLQRKADTLRKLDIPAIEKMFIALQQEDSKLFGPMVEEMRDKMYDEMRAGFKKQATMVPGYSTDFGRVTGAYIGWTSNHAADLQHGDAIRSAQENYIDSHPDKNVRRYWDRWTDYQNNPAEEMQKLRQFGFYWQLAANPSSTLLIATHGPMVAHATLGAGVGYAAAGKHLYSAFGEALRNIGFDAKDGAHINMENMGRTPAEKALVKDALGTGLVHSSAADDLRGLGQGQAEMMGVDGKKWRRTLNILSSNIAVADQMNRVGTLLGSYRLASQPGMMEKIAKTWGDNQVFAETMARNGLTPENVAKFMVDEGLFVWGKRNRAPMQRGAGALLFQFKNFEANYLGTLWKFMSRMGPEGKVAGTFMLASLGAMGGALSLPFTDDIIKAGDWIGEKMNGIDPMIESKIYQLMENAGMSKMGAEAMLRGPSRSMLGVDLSSRLGLGEAVSRNMSALDALGTVPSMMISRISSAWNRYQHGQPLAAAADLLPTAARNLVRGSGVLPNEGLRSQFGNQIIPKDKLSAADHVAAAAGFEPAPVARAYEQHEFEKRTAAANRELTSRLTTEVVDLEGQIVDANKRGDAQASAKMLDRLQQIYRDNPEVKISRQAVRHGLERQVDPVGSAKRLMPKTARNQESPYVGQ